MGFHILNPPEPRCNRVRSTGYQQGGYVWQCGQCKCVPEAWKLTVPPASPLLSDRVGTFLLVRDDPKNAVGCIWSTPRGPWAGWGPGSSQEFNLSAWHLRYGLFKNIGWGSGSPASLFSGWGIASGDYLFVFQFAGEWTVEPTPFRCLDANSFLFFRQSGQPDYGSNDPGPLTLEPYWK